MRKGMTSQFMGGGNPLPYDAEVEWISTDGQSGDQYIDTGILPSEKGRYYIKALVPFLRTRFIGEFDSGYSTCNCLATGDSNYTWFPNKYGGSGTTSGWADPATFFNIQNGPYVYDWDFENGRQTYKLSGCTISTTSRTWTGTPTQNIRLFKISSSYGGYAKVYFCKIYGGDSYGLQRDYIPVRVGSVGYLYDKANPAGGPLGNGLYPNQGTGNFIVGPDKVSIPSYSTNGLVGYWDAERNNSNRFVNLADGTSVEFSGQNAVAGNYFNLTETQQTGCFATSSDATLEIVFSAEVSPWTEGDGPIVFKALNSAVYAKENCVGSAMLLGSMYRSGNYGQPLYSISISLNDYNNGKIHINGNTVDTSYHWSWVFGSFDQVTFDYRYSGMKIHSARVYNRSITSAEVASNFLADSMRFFV